MVAYNFNVKFSRLVVDGIKRQTVRLPRKRKTVRGDALQLYTGQRTKKCLKLRDAVCVSTQTFGIDDVGNVSVGDEVLSYQAEREFAWRDGFSRVDEFLDFFRKHYALPFGPAEVISWNVRVADTRTYGVVDARYHMAWSFKRQDGERLIYREGSLMRQFIDSGFSFWCSKSGGVWAVLPWKWDLWADSVYILPSWIMDGIPLAWRAWDPQLAPKENWSLAVQSGDWEVLS